MFTVEYYMHMIREYAESNRELVEMLARSCEILEVHGVDITREGGKLSSWWANYIIDRDKIEAQQKAREVALAKLSLSDRKALGLL